MPKNENQKLRLLYLLQILKTETDEMHPMSLPRILEKLALQNIVCERKTLYDDFRLLEEYGAEVIYNRGKDGGYYLTEREFEPCELKILTDAVQSAKFITHQKSQALIKKIQALGGKYAASDLKKQTFIDNSIKTKNESIYYNIDKIFDAITANSQIEFLYFEWVIDLKTPDKRTKSYRKSGENYRVSPLGLCWVDEYYYLIAYDEKAAAKRHYRVDKMEKVERTTMPRSGDSESIGLDTADYIRPIFGMFGGTAVPLKLRFENRLIGVVIDRFGSDVFITPDGDEHFNLSVNVTISPLFYSWIISFGGAAKIISPNSEAVAYKEFIKKALEG